MTYDPDIHALNTFGLELEAVATASPRSRRWRWWALGIGAGVAIATPALATSGTFDFGHDVPADGQPGGAPATVTHAPASDTVDVLATLLERDGVAKLRRRIAPYSLALRVKLSPVAELAAGRVLSVQFPHRARFNPARQLVLSRSRGTIIATIGRTARPSEDVGTRGLSLYDVLPSVRAAVQRDDPDGTVRRLRDLGFDVDLKLVIDNPRAHETGTSATGSKSVTASPPDTVVLSVLNSRGENSAQRDTRNLIVEIAPADSDIARSDP
jgi:hypothetical protein